MPSKEKKEKKKKPFSFMKHNVLYLYLAQAAVTVLAKNTR